MDQPQVGGPTRFGLIARLPIGIKLPLAAGAIVVTVAVILGYAAHQSTRRALREMAIQRQTQVAKSFARIMGQGSATVYRSQVAAMAKKPALMSYLHDSASVSRFAALDAMEFSSPSRAQDTQVVAVELITTSGVRLLGTGRGVPLLDSLPGRDALPRPANTDSAALGRYAVRGDTVLFPVVARVGNAEPGGYLVLWRRVIGSADVRALIGDLLGTNGTLLYGNSDGTVWHDIGAPVAGPLLPSMPADTLVSYHRAGRQGRMLGKVLSLDGSPWSVIVEFPEDTIYAPMPAFTRRLGMIGLGGLTVALLLAWLLTRRLTRPLAHLTAAAEALSDGRAQQPVAMLRADELGTLGRTFDAMARQVAEARTRLEEKVEERTRELNDTLVQLQHAQEALVRREKLAMLGQLASSVGHELRNPLGVMNNAVYYLEMVLTDAPANVREYLGILRDQVKVSGKIINDLLDFSRISAAQRQTVDIRQVVMNQLAQVPMPPHIDVTTDMPHDLPAVDVDPVHAGQVLLNLITNAVQAMGDAGGTLSIRAHVNGAARVHIDVRDTGPGIAPENRERIFEPLFTTKARGIGLGLPVSRSLAQVNDGDLSCESAPGEGAMFTLALPIAKEPR